MKKTVCKKQSCSKLPAIAVFMLLAMAFSGAVKAQDQHRHRTPESCERDGHAPKMQHPIPGPFGNYEQIPGITDKQKEEIKVIRIALLKELKVFADQINEKEARLRTLSGADPYDVKAVEKLIDEIAVLHAEQRKRTERARHQIRLLLNDEQKLWFDRHCQGHMRGEGHPPRKGKPKGKQRP